MSRKKSIIPRVGLLHSVGAVQGNFGKFTARWCRRSNPPTAVPADLRECLQVADLDKRLQWMRHTFAGAARSCRSNVDGAFTETLGAVSMFKTVGVAVMLVAEHILGVLAVIIVALVSSVFLVFISIGSLMGFLFGRPKKTGQIA